MDPTPAGDEWPVLQVRQRQTVQRHPVRQVEPPVRADDDVVADLEVVDERLDDAAGHGRFDLQQRGRRMSHLLERAIDTLKKIVPGVVQRLDAGIADHPEQVGADNLHVRKQLRKVGADHVLEKRELERAPVVRLVDGRGTKRGNGGGILTRAKRVRRCGRTITAKFLLRSR